MALRRRRGCHAHEEFAIERSGGGQGSWHCAKLTRQSITPWLIHGGTALQQREKATVLPWNDLSQLIEKIAS